MFNMQRSSIISGVCLPFISSHCLCLTVVTPLMYVAYEGLLNTTFQCNVTGADSSHYPVWIVDGKPLLNYGLEYETFKSRGITVTEIAVLDEYTVQGTLTIAANKDNRNTTISCEGFRVQGAVSEIATFMVQGKK